MSSAVPGIRIPGISRTPDQGGGWSTNSNGGVVRPLPPGQQGPPGAPPNPFATGASATSGLGGGSALVPAAVSKINVTGTAPKELTDYAAQYEQHLKDLEAGKTREADVYASGLNSDIERQIATARQQAASEGRPFNEAAMRAELTRGKNSGMAQFELGSQQQATSALQGGLPIMQAPENASLAEKNLSLDTQKELLDYALGRGQLGVDEQRNEVMAATSAQNAYTQMLATLANMANSYSY